MEPLKWNPIQRIQALTHCRPLTVTLIATYSNPNSNLSSLIVTFAVIVVPLSGTLYRTPLNPNPPPPQRILPGRSSRASLSRLRLWSRSCGRSAQFFSNEENEEGEVWGFRFRLFRGFFLKNALSGALYCMLRCWDCARFGVEHCRFG